MSHRGWSVLLAAEGLGAGVLLVGLLRGAIHPFHLPLHGGLELLGILILGGLAVVSLRAAARRFLPGDDARRAIALAAAPLLTGWWCLLFAAIEGRHHVALASLFSRPLWAVFLVALVAVGVHAAAHRGPAPPARPSGSTGGWRAQAFVGAMVFLLLVLHASGRIGRMPIATGDEPHYAIAAESLIDDGDLSLVDDATFPRTQIWYPSPLPARPQLIHVPGFSVFLIPFVQLGRWVSGLESLGGVPGGPALFIARLLGILGAVGMAAATTAIVGRLTRERILAVGAGLTVGLGFPVAVVAPTLYPETLAGAAMATAFALLLRGREHTSIWSGAVLAVLLFCLPWLGLKYTPAAALLVLLIPAFAPADRRLRSALLPTFGFVAGMALLSAYARLLTGRFSPGAIKGAMGSDALHGLDLETLGYIAQTGVGYFLDQTEGLIWHAPWVLVALALYPSVLRHHRREGLALGILLLGYLGHYAFHRQWSQAGPPGRPPTAAIWALATILALGLARPARRWLRPWVALSLVATAFVTALLWAEPSAVNQPHQWRDYDHWHPFLLWADALLPVPVSLWPDFMQRDARWGVLLAWLVLMLLAAILLARTRSDEHSDGDPPFAFAAAATSLGLLLVVLPAGRWVRELRSPLSTLPPERPALVPLQPYDAHAVGDRWWTRGRIPVRFAVRVPEDSPLPALEIFVPALSTVDFEVFGESSLERIVGAHRRSLPPDHFLELDGARLWLPRIHGDQDFRARHILGQDDQRTLGVAVGLSPP